jgi:hypothetical protein
VLGRSQLQVDHRVEVTRLQVPRLGAHRSAAATLAPHAASEVPLDVGQDQHGCPASALCG